VRKFIEYILGTLGFLLLFYFVTMLFLSNWGENRVFFWTLTFIICAVILAGAFIQAFRPADRKGSPLYLFLAVVAVFALALFVGSPHWNEIDSGTQFFISAGVIGVPLGLGASDSLKGKLYAAAEGDIAVGMLTGILGAGAALFMLGNMGWKLHVPLRDILTYNPFGLELFPNATKTAVECAFGMGPCPLDETARGVWWRLALAVQGVQAGIAALWDTILIGGVVYAATAGGRTAFGMRS
jgi:hypothetical protein